MDNRRDVDGLGALALVGFSALLAFNQVVIKVTGGGFDPVFQAGIRSVGATFVILLWMRLRGLRFDNQPGVMFWGTISGTLFAYEFVCLFIALDVTTVARASIMFYTMPIWLSIAAHFVLPGERLTGVRMLGLVCGMSGVVWALVDRGDGQGNLFGDLIALAGSLGWAAIALLVRLTPLARVQAETQMLFQLVPSAVILLALAPLFGDMIREPETIHYAALAFQMICVASLGFLSWFYLMKVYKANGVASFAFLSPVFAVLFGWLILGEETGVQIWGALALVAAGIFLINGR
ncbi:MAG: DMT family transporter [Paracoccaceae bacterium]